jgi:3-hydroxybutyrate dehydrogenase
MKMMLLKNKTAIITGAASGIGKEIAIHFAKAGANVVIADRDIQKAKETAEIIKSEGGLSTVLEMDVANEAEVNIGIQQAIDEFGDIHILVSNAGIQYISPLHEFPYSEWKKIITIHLDGAFLTTKACLKNMYAHKKGGSIIYMGSVHSKIASVLKAPYVTAKHGLMGLCKIVAKEGAAYNVRANVICPGFVRTPLVDKQIPDQAKTLGLSEDEVIKKIMLKDTIDGEFTTVTDVADVALFFASFSSNALTGQSLIVSHGWCME